METHRHQRIPIPPLYTSGCLRLSQRTPDKRNKNWEVILEQCPGATGTSVKHWVSQENMMCLHHGRTCSGAGSSSIIPHAILNASENFGKNSLSVYLPLLLCSTETMYFCLFITRAKAKGAWVYFILDHFACRCITWNFLPNLTDRRPLVWVSLCKGFNSLIPPYWTKYKRGGK